MSSVASQASSIFPVARSLPGPRGSGQEPATQGSEEFAALLDQEPPAPRERASDSKRRNDTAPAHGRHGTQPSREARDASDAEAAEPSAAAEAPGQTKAKANKDDSTEPMEGEQAAAAKSAEPEKSEAAAVAADAAQGEAAEALFAANAIPAPAASASPVVVTAPVASVAAAPMAPDTPAVAPAIAPDTPAPGPDAMPAAAQHGLETAMAAAGKPVPVAAGPGQPSPAPITTDASNGEIVATTAKPAQPPAAPTPKDAGLPDLAAAKAATPAQGPAPATPTAPAAPTPAVKPEAPADAAVSSDGSGALKIAAEAIQNLATHAPAAPLGVTHVQSTAAAHAAAAAAPAQPNPAAIPVTGLAVEIATQAFAGKQRFEIRLDPPELGRIDVRLEIDRDGNVSSKLVVERSETLDMLRRDAPQLERALQQAGLKTSDNALEFSLRQHTAERDNHASSRGGADEADDEVAAIDTAHVNYGRRLTLGGGIDIRV